MKKIEKKEVKIARLWEKELDRYKNEAETLKHDLKQALDVIEVKDREIKGLRQSVLWREKKIAEFEKELDSWKETVDALETLVDSLSGTKDKSGKVGRDAPCESQSKSTDTRPSETEKRKSNYQSRELTDSKNKSADSESQCECGHPFHSETCRFTLDGPIGRDICYCIKFKEERR